MLQYARVTKIQVYEISKYRNTDFKLKPLLRRKILYFVIEKYIC